MADGTVDFRLRLQDDLSKEMKKARKLTESSLKSMSKEQIKLNKQVASHEDKVVKLQHTLHNASKERKKDIREEIRLEKLLLGQKKKQLTQANRSQQVRTKTTFSDKISKGVSGGISGAVGKLGAVGAVGGAVIGGAIQLRDIMLQNEKINQRLRFAFKLTGDDLNAMNAQVKTLGMTFDEDYNQIIIAANTLSKQMGISGKEAMDLISKGFQKGANFNNEFLDILKEYPASLKAAGVAADDAISIMTQQIKDGVYSDKGVDLINEGRIRLTEHNEATQKALAMLPIQIQDNIALATAQGKTYEAMQLVAGEMENFSKSDQAIITKAIFGSIGEDGAAGLIKMLTHTTKNLDDLDNTMSDFQTSTMEMNSAWNKLTADVSDGENIIGSVFDNLTRKTTILLNGFNKLSSGSNTERWETIGNTILGIGEAVIDPTGGLDVGRFGDKRRANKESRKYGPSIKAESESGIISTPGAIGSSYKGFQYKTSKRETDAERDKRLEKNAIVAEKAKAKAIRDRERFERRRERMADRARNIQSNLVNVETSKAVKSLTINIGSLVKDGIQIETTNITESTAQIEQMMVKMLTKVVNQAGSKSLG